MNLKVGGERLVTVFLCGDVMTGRGIDQILPHPSDPRIQKRASQMPVCTSHWPGFRIMGRGSRGWQPSSPLGMNITMQGRGGKPCRGTSAWSRVP